VISAAIAFAAAAAAGLIILPVLRRVKAGQSIRDDGPKWHMTKQGTPIMGGFIFIIGAAAACVAAGMTTQTQASTILFIFAFALVFGAIGFLDDYEKVRRRQNLGLTALQKLLLQLAVAVAFILLMRLAGNLTPNLYIPFANVSIPLPEPLYLVVAAFVIVAEVNAVNLTDGVDGLCTGVTIPVCIAFAAIAYVWGAEYLGIGIFASALCGGLAGFLLYNFHPAKIFMGDTGSLFLGGAVCGMAFALDMPMILLPLGVIYLIETLSDVIQVVYFKLSHGRRIFKMAPIHHHLEMNGWSEHKLFFVFTLVSAAFAVISFLGVYRRFGA
jgi:phospho-N-acetylmuramoyl-pentapeptide-transferase